MRYSFTSFDGKEISVLEWSDVASPKGIIQISHGMAEHAGRYDAFAKKMNEHGYIVFADDHRAHGQTDPDTPGYCKGDIYGDTLKDMALLAKEYKKKYNLPVFLFSHSYGSFLGQRYIQESADILSGAILGGSSYMKIFTTRLGAFLSGFACAIGRGKKPSNTLKKASFDAYDKKFGGQSFISSVPEECERYFNDKDCGFICSNNFYNNFFKGVLKSYKKENLANIDKNMPILLMSGACDPVGEMGKGVEKLEKMYDSIGTNVKKVLYDGARHEYLNDICREEAYRDVAAFFDECLEKARG